MAMNQHRKRQRSIRKVVTHLYVRTTYRRRAINHDRSLIDARWSGALPPRTSETIAPPQSSDVWNLERFGNVFKPSSLDETDTCPL